MYDFYKNKRRKTDLILTLLAWMNGIAGFSLFIALFLFAFAKPDLETFFDRYYNVNLRNSWNQEFFSYIAFFLSISLFSSIVGLYLNSKRLRRKGDHIRAILVISLILSIISLIFLIRLAS